MFTRRNFLTAGALASASAVPHLEAEPLNTQSTTTTTEIVSLNGEWRFRLDRDDSWRTVEVPHTWQIEPENAGYMGVAWYRRTFEAPQLWSRKAVRIEFEAVFHTATIRINGHEAGRHIGKGYTAFTFDIGKLLRYGEPNVVEVRVDNSFNESMLPRGRSSDWAHDGGIYRPAQLLVTPKVFIERLAVDTELDLTSGTATVQATAVVRNTSAVPWEGSLGVRLLEDRTGLTSGSSSHAVTIRLVPGETKTVRLADVPIAQPRLWHFDDPQLYRGIVELSGGHALETTFGIRKIEIRGNRFYLNGEAVRLMGVERMAGSNPEYGMAEPSSWIDHDHADMKELNCVYTRVHWPQDRRVLDWCDRHGMFIQTEVPAWGPNTFRGMSGEPDAAILNNGLEQLREMVARDRNHPCIFSWGVCNEVNGQNPPAYAFAKHLYDEAKRLDPKRLVSYASHSLFQNPGKDVSGLMDYVMFNQYFGSWQRGGPTELGKTLDDIHEAFPDKPLVISEWVYCACTADRPEGDEKRLWVLETQDPVFRERDYIAGLIFFDYNDYRTHVGDRGMGVMKQRVHGVVDVYGARKPSYAELRRQSSPLEKFDISVEGPIVNVRLKARASVPSYSLRGYRLRAVVYGQGGIPVERLDSAVETLGPGQEFAATLRFTEPKPSRIDLDLMRPTGCSAISTTWKT
jgi:beta-galactosidase